MPKHAATRQAKPLHVRKARPAAFNRAPSPRWVANYREQIHTYSLIKRLQTFALSDPDAPTGPRMTRTQATVALSLLRKVLPDMQALEISGNSEKPLVVQVMRFSDSLVIDADHNGVPALAESGTKPTASEVDELPDAIEHNPRLIEDEPASPRRTSRHRRNQ